MVKADRATYEGLCAHVLTRRAEPRPGPEGPLRHVACSASPRCQEGGEESAEIVEVL